MAGSHKPRNEARLTDMEMDPYAVLSVDREADEAAIRQAYLELVRRHPPEQNPDMFKRIRRAYELLATAEARAATRLWLPEPPPGDSLTADVDLNARGAPGMDKPALAGIPLAFLLSLDPFSDLVRTNLPEDTDDG